MKILYLFGLSFLLALMPIAIYGQRQTLVFDDFEGTFDKWTVQGEAFGAGPINGATAHQNKVTNYRGTGIANSYHGGDDTEGEMTSVPFTINRHYINFMIGGGKRDGLYIELLVNGKSVRKMYAPIDAEMLNWMSWDVKDIEGQKAVFHIVDHQRGGYGHILIDQIELSDAPQADYETNCKRSFDINSKYLLIPIQDNASGIRTLVTRNNIPDPTKVDINIAKDRIDYWIPVDVSKYKGQTVSLTFDAIQKSAIGFSKIKQSDIFPINFDEKYRPLYHFTAPYGWLNDPNGQVYYDGEYHLFYQYNPYGNPGANKSWGHAVSPDLITWKDLPVAIVPNKLGTIWSGSAVVDKNNTAGFGKNAMLAFYTGAEDAIGQKQMLAYSTDKGRTFTNYVGNPIIKDTAQLHDFRDPKVFWHAPSKEWVMALATSQTITFYGSKDLKKWNKLSSFGNGIGDHSSVWECPSLYETSYHGLPKWVLLVSNAGAIQYFIGNFDGTHFVADKLPYPLILDYGRDVYAGSTWANIPAKDNRTLFIGWMTTWKWDLPSKNFVGSMTVPRQLKIVNNGEHLVVANPPVHELMALRGKPVTYHNFENSSTKNTTLPQLLKQNSGAYELTMTINRKTSHQFGFTLSNTQGEDLKFRVDLDRAEFSTDRSNSGICKFDTNVRSGHIVPKDKYSIQLLVDNGSVECFINEGELVFTTIVYPTDPYNTLSLNSDNDIAVENLTIYPITKKMR